MVDYLCGLGHRRIAIITACEDDISIGRLRLNAYRQALLDHGIPYDPDLVFHMTKDDTYSFATGYKITKEILEKDGVFRAVCHRGYAGNRCVPCLKRGRLYRAG